MANGKTWFKVEAKATGRAEILIYNDIGDFGVTAQDFADALDTAGSVSTLDVRISSNGGDVSTGFAIFNMLERHSARKVVTVDGLAASMASVIAMAGDEVHMPANSMLMIHNPWGVAMGGADQIKSFGDALEQMQQQIADAYVARTGISEDEIFAMMAKETWLSAKRAVSLGFADSVGAALDVKATFDVSKFNRVPKAFKAENDRKKASMSKKTSAQIAADAAALENDDAEAGKTEAQIRAEIVEHSREVRSLCNLVGFPALAEGFIEKGTPILGDKGVVAALDAAKTEKAEKDAAAANRGKTRVAGARTELQNHSGNGLDGAPRAEIDPRAIYNKWNKTGGGK